MNSEKVFAVFYKWKYEPTTKILVGVAASYELATKVAEGDQKVHRGKGEYVIEVTDFYKIA